MPHPRPRRAQALVEAAVMLPLLVLIGFGAVGVARILQVRLGVDAIAREAARAAALAPMPIVVDGTARNNAHDTGLTTGNQVAASYGLSSAQVEVDASDFGPGGWVTADAIYNVRFNVPIMRDLLNGIRVHGHHLERVDEFRSRSP